jgi:hypothetical protein
MDEYDGTRDTRKREVVELVDKLLAQKLISI